MVPKGVGVDVQYSRWLQRLAGVGVLVSTLTGCDSRGSVVEWLPPLPEALRVEVRERTPQKSPAAYALQREEAINQALVFDELTGSFSFSGETHYIIATSFRFDPDTLFLRAGSLVRLRLGNPSLISHYFGGEEFFRYGAEIVDLFGEDTPVNRHHIEVPPHQVVDLYLFIKDPGEYRMDCFVPAHRLEGMVGAIVVEGPPET